MTAISSTHYKVIYSSPLSPSLQETTTTVPERLEPIHSNISNSMAPPGKYYLLVYRHTSRDCEDHKSCSIQYANLMRDLEFLTIKLSELAFEKTDKAAELALSNIDKDAKYNKDIAISILTKELASIKIKKEYLEKILHALDHGHLKEKCSKSHYLRIYNHKKPLISHVYAGFISKDQTVDLKGKPADTVELETKHAFFHSHQQNLPQNPKDLVEMLTWVRQDLLYYKKIHKETPANDQTEFFLQALGREIAEDKCLKDKIKQEIKKHAAKS